MRELANAAGIALGFLQKVERAKTNVGVAVLVRLADALGIPPGLLFRRRELPEMKRGRPKRVPGAQVVPPDLAAQDDLADQSKSTYLSARFL